MNRSFNRGLLFFLLLTLGFVPLWSEVKIPAGTETVLYVKNIKTLQEDLKTSGFWTLSEEKLDWLLDYLQKGHPGLAMVRDFRMLDNGDFRRALSGTFVMLELKGGTVFAVQLEKEAAYASKILSLARTRGKLSGFSFEFIGDTVVFSRSPEAIHLYKTSTNTLNDPAFTSQYVQNPDLLYYSRQPNSLTGWMNAFLDLKAGTSMALSLLFEKRAVLMSLGGNQPVYRYQRTQNCGKAVPAESLFYCDITSTPAEFFGRFFGKERVSQISGFNNAFDPHIGFSVLDYSESKEPTLLFVLKSRGANSVNLWNGFLKDMVGVTNWDAGKIEGMDVIYNEEVGLWSAAVDDLILVSDHEYGIERSIGALRGRSPSVWDRKENAKIRELGDRPGVYFFSFDSIAGKIGESMRASLDIAERDMEDLLGYVDVIGKWGTMVGYSENRKDYQYFYFMMKNR